MKGSQLKNIVNIKGEILLVSGLHVGAGNDEIHIGGIDNPVIKNPLTGEPYIPGSSLKGKIRTLLELSLGKIASDGGPYYVEKGTDILCELFGNGNPEKKTYEGGITRLIFNDSYLQNEIKAMMIRKNALTESKTEVSIDRIRGTATAGVGPRQMERIPAGARFNFSVSIRIFDGDIESAYLNYLALGLKLLENDALGGSGSRGYGRVRFSALSLSSMTLDETPFDLVEASSLKKLMDTVNA